ncbi:MAG: MotA/TolQ/ExbB proton channel family protein [Candidatus Aminicenantaceae bacterium]
MPSKSHLNTKLKVLVRILIVAALVAAVILSGRFTDFLSGPGLVFVLLGGVALALMGFSASEIKAAFKHASGRTGTYPELQKSAYFWETCTRNVWTLGVLGSVISFIIALGISEGGILGITLRMSKSFLTTVYGMVFGVVCFVPALKLTREVNKLQHTEVPEAEEGRPESIFKNFRFDNIIGYALFIAVVGWVIASSLLSKPLDGSLSPSKFFIHWPSLLVVVGGTGVIAIFIGNVASGQSFTLGFALTGIIGILMGFVQVLISMSSRPIKDVASAVAFIISSCFVALLGIMLVGAPLEDHTFKVRKKNKQLTLSRIVWFVFPLVVFFVLALTFVLVITPVKK